VLSARNGNEEPGKVPFRRSKLYPDYYQNNFHYQTGAARPHLEMQQLVLCTL
jgi:hypothetical protein